MFSQTNLKTLRLFVVALALVIGAAAGTARAQYATNLQLQYLPAGMVAPGSGTGTTADWTNNVGPAAAKLINLPTFTLLNPTPGGTPPSGITSSFTIAGGNTANTANQLNHATQDT